VEIRLNQPQLLPAAGSSRLDRSHAKVIIAASLGAMFECYDFFIYGAVAVLLSQHFFQGVNETTSLILALLGFAAGFAVRPLGAVFFGWLGDLAGRKNTFLATIVLMGVSTALIGVLPKQTENFRAQLSSALVDAGYPRSTDHPKINYPVVLLLLCLLAVYAILTYAPVVAWLVELFPPQIRYTSMSVPYHVGVGWLGGFLPSIAFAITAYTGDIYAGLWYPVIVASITLVVGFFFVPETSGIAAKN